MPGVNPPEVQPRQARESTGIKVLLILLILLMLVLGWWRCYCSLVDAQNCYKGFASEIGLPSAAIILLCDMVILLGILAIPLMLILGGSRYNANTTQRLLITALVISLVLSLDTVHDQLVISCQNSRLRRSGLKARKSGEIESKYSICTLLVVMLASFAILLSVTSGAGVQCWSLAPYGIFAVWLLLQICTSE